MRSLGPEGDVRDHRGKEPSRSLGTPQVQVPALEKTCGDI